MILVWVAILAALMLTGLVISNAADKMHRLYAIGLFIILCICLMGFTISNYEFIPKQGKTQSATDEQTEDVTSGSALSIDSTELENMLSHSADIDIEKAVVTVGDYKTGLGLSLDTYLGVKEDNDLDMYTYTDLSVGNIAANGYENFYLVKDAPQDYHMYAYAYNTQDYTIPIGYMTIGEIWVDLQRMPEASIFGFTSETNYEDVLKAFGDPEYVSNDDVQHIWSTEWGHINITFADNGCVSTVDAMMHDELLEGLKLDLGEGGRDELDEEVEANEKAYQDRVTSDSVSDAE